MQDGVILVNTSRGEVVNTSDLVDGLKSGKVFGAALDVFEGEKAFMFKDMSTKGFEDYPELEELAKMHIQIRKEMDDKLRLERNSLKMALDSAHVNEKDKAISDALKAKERDIKNMENTFQEEKNRLQNSITELKRQIAEKEQKMTKAVSDARKEGDKKV